MRKSSLFVIFGLLFAAYAAVPAPANAADAASGRPAAIANVIAATSSSRPALANMRAPNMSVAIPKPSIQATVSGPGHVAGGTGTGTGNGGAVTATPPAEKNSATCREAYRQCMDDFCLMDESEGLRCACSDNINASKSLIKSITDVQQQAEDLYTTGVEREKLGAQAMIVFGTGAKARSRGIDWSTWMNSGDSASLDSDQDIGDSLFAMAADGCKARLAACGPDADMEETLYSRMIANDCKHFSAFLKDQQKIANNNLAAGQKAVRAARTSMLATTNKYNRGECLLALKSCIATKGGCGDNFENCLDASLLARRTKACDNILDQCMYTRDEVLDDWAAESKRVLADAAKYADMNKRNTCLARIRACLSDNCSASYDVKNATDSACLTNVNIAAGICPIITECNTLVPGLKNVIGDQLAYLRVQFCQNDIDKCLQDKCGADYTAPECLGKRTADILDMCPQDMFPSCKGQKQFDAIVSAALLQIDYQMLQGCINYFSDQLGRVCGLDMTCLPNDPSIETAKTMADVMSLFVMGDNNKPLYAANADASVDQFFRQFEKDVLVKQCASIGKNIFNTAKLIAYIGAENRNYRALQSKVADLARKADLATAHAACETLFNTKKSTDSATARSAKESGKWVTDWTFEPDLRNCHICYVQKVCEEGGESKWASGAKMAAGGAAGGAAAGTMVTPGWGTVIGAGVGILGGVIGGLTAPGEKTFCQELPVCEDINMGAAGADQSSVTTVPAASASGGMLTAPIIMR